MGIKWIENIHFSLSQALTLPIMPSTNSFLCIIPENFAQKQAYLNTSPPVGLSPYSQSYGSLSLFTIS